MTPLLPEVEQTCNEISAFFELLQHDYEAEGIDDLHLRKSIVLNIAQSFYYDLDRYEKFHKIAIPDRARRAAYLCKWIIKFHPITFEKSTVELSDTLTEKQMERRILVNEYFCFLVAEGMMRIDFEKHLPQSVIKLLIYTFRYRTVGDDWLILFFYHLFEHHKIVHSTKKAPKTQ